MFIDWMLIMRAVGWHTVGAGMLAKNAYDSHSVKKEQRSYDDYISPVRNWWNRYGVSYDECLKFDNKYTSDAAFRRSVLDRVKSAVNSDDMYIKYLLGTGGNSPLTRNHIMALYYASNGRAARMSVNAFFPSAGAFENHLVLKRELIRLLAKNGVVDLHWFCEPEETQKRRLDELKNG